MNDTGKSKSVRGTNDWWRGAVIYQVYPRSYRDTNNDGIGDLAGICEKLPYIASLGVDAVWISPFFKSPMKDFGYDVSDYHDVDPIFGTLDDFKTLMAEARRLNLKIMIDLVLSHTSDQHEWFQQSRSDRDNDRADWYVWSEPKPDGTAPNNWLSIFGGSAWQWDTRRRQYYLHNFLASQPDLNFHYPAVQNAVLDVARFWLELGVSGFRLDTINFYFCDQKLRNNPPLPPERRSAAIAPEVNPYNHQDHLYDKNRPENPVFLERLRALMDEYPQTAMLGEVGDAQYGLELLAEYTSGNKRAHMCYGFDFLSERQLTPALAREVVENTHRAAPDSWSCWAFSNHDVVRCATRWGKHEPDANAYLRVLAAVLLFLRGSVCLYQGEELGLTEADIAYDDLRDPYGIQFWPEFKGRDGCRTPMVWQHGTEYVGFSATKPWLPVSDEHRELTVDVQQTRAKSLLSHHQKLLAFRRSHSAFVSGDINFRESSDNVLAFTRVDETETLLCAFNMSATAADITLKDEPLQTLSGHGFADSQIQNGKLHLNPYGAFFARLN